MKVAHQHAQNATFGLFAAAKLFVEICPFAYPVDRHSCFKILPVGCEDGIYPDEMEDFVGNLTHSCLEINLAGVVWTCQSFENNFGINHNFLKYLKESCEWISDEQFFFQYLKKIFC